MPAFVKYHSVDIEVTSLVKGSVTALFACSIWCCVGHLSWILLNSVIVLFPWTWPRRLLGIMHACLVANNVAVGHFTLGSALSLSESRHALCILRPTIRGVAGRRILHNLQRVAIVEVVIDEVCILKVAFTAFAAPGFVATRPRHLREEAGCGQLGALYALQVTTRPTPGRLVGSHNSGLVEHACCCLRLCL